MSVPNKDPVVAPKLSLSLFFASVLGTLAAVALGMRFCLPGFWEAQWSAGWPAITLTFLVLHFNLCVFEFFFHRYVLHRVVFSVLHGFARSHRQHHGLTPVVRLDPGKTGGEVPVRNQYPIVEERQYPSSFFPYHSLAAFLAVFTPWFAFLQFLLPKAPIIIGGYLAVTWSYALYEMIHATEHRSYEGWWRSKVQHPRWGSFWTRVYGFHLMHHACVRANEAIGGFFGLPLADWLFGTYKQPRLLFANGELASAEDLAAPTPHPFIRWLDRVTQDIEDRYVERRKAKALTLAKDKHSRS